ncbi:hypothetical protein MOC55_13765 [Bacillus spizizenii]|uniref:Uncharacterized protein n=1 Tax=Bacillus spizizenii TaxID=96241 RepID=A0A9Q4DWB9_BACSC|nr:hypothetical protein [Bacillus spizizenii]MCY8155531.1 hypothetical protein [Bacillus spizizenii]MCY8312929.1 hypothetical protein [Bacillus spizizenii]MCY8416656.1 hypothetical protein [Bacillus spizizenii]MCY9333730.1 hypothetical protein [Bacillus spizizenii]
MAIRFGDLYEEMLTLEEAIERMKVDIQNADCDSDTKCILQNELEMLEQKYYELSLTEFDFEKLNFVSIVESIERCLHCIEFAGNFSDLAPAPIAVASTCGNKKVQLSLGDIERVIVHEFSSKATSYDFVKSAMPYTIKTKDKEKYVVTWDSYRKGVSIKGFNTNPGGTVTNYGNISKVEAVLNEPAQKKYKKEKVMACKVLLASRTPMTSSAPLTRAVDGKTTTYPKVAKTTKSEVEMIFQIFV